MDREELGQELDRWQIIARDLIQDFVEKETAPEWVQKVAHELEQMKEMRFNWHTRP